MPTLIVLYVNPNVIKPKPLTRLVSDIEQMQCDVIVLESFYQTTALFVTSIGPKCTSVVWDAILRAATDKLILTERTLPEEK